MEAVPTTSERSNVSRLHMKSLRQTDGSQGAPAQAEMLREQDETAEWEADTPRSVRGSARRSARSSASGRSAGARQRGDEAQNNRDDDGVSESKESGSRRPPPPSAPPQREAGSAAGSSTSAMVRAQLYKLRKLRREKREQMRDQEPSGSPAAASAAAADPVSLLNFDTLAIAREARKKAASSTPRAVGLNLVQNDHHVDTGGHNVAALETALDIDIDEADSIPEAKLRHDDHDNDHDHDDADADSKAPSKGLRSFPNQGGTPSGVPHGELEDLEDPEFPRPSSSRSSRREPAQPCSEGAVEDDLEMESLASAGDTGADLEAEIRVTSVDATRGFEVFSPAADPEDLASSAIASASALAADGPDDADLDLARHELEQRRAANTKSDLAAASSSPSRHAPDPSGQGGIQVDLPRIQVDAGGLRSELGAGAARSSGSSGSSSKSASQQQAAAEPELEAPKGERKKDRKPRKSTSASAPSAKRSGSRSGSRSGRSSGKSEEEGAQAAASGSSVHRNLRVDTSHQEAGELYGGGAEEESTEWHEWQAQYSYQDGGGGANNFQTDKNDDTEDDTWNTSGQGDSAGAGHGAASQQWYQGEYGAQEGAATTGAAAGTEEVESQFYHWDSISGTYVTWAIYHTEEGVPYYYCEATQESRWTDPRLQESEYEIQGADRQWSEHWHEQAQAYQEQNSGPSVTTNYAATSRPTADTNRSEARQTQSSRNLMGYREQRQSQPKMEKRNSSGRWSVHDLDRMERQGFLSARSTARVAVFGTVDPAEAPQSPVPPLDLPGISNGTARGGSNQSSWSRNSANALHSAYLHGGPSTRSIYGTEISGMPGKTPREMELESQLRYLSARAQWLEQEAFYSKEAERAAAARAEYTARTQADMVSRARHAERQRSMIDMSLITQALGEDSSAHQDHRSSPHQEEYNESKSQDRDYYAESKMLESKVWN